MAQTTTIGRVTADLELKTSVNKNPYVLFSIAERIGYGEQARTQYFQVWAWGDLARQLIRRGVKRGSLIWVSGSLELTAYTKQDGVTRDKQMKLTLKDWDFVPISDRSRQKPGQTADASKAPAPAPPPVRIIDGERESLPE